MCHWCYKMEYRRVINFPMSKEKFEIIQDLLESQFEKDKENQIIRELERNRKRLLILNKMIEMEKNKLNSFI